MVKCKYVEIQLFFKLCNQSSPKCFRFSQNSLRTSTLTLNFQIPYLDFQDPPQSGSNLPSNFHANLKDSTFLKLLSSETIFKFKPHKVSLYPQPEGVSLTELPKPLIYSFSYSISMVHRVMPMSPHLLSVFPFISCKFLHGSGIYV